jgi:hypothetical protein
MVPVTFTIQEFSEIDVSMKTKKKIILKFYYVTVGIQDICLYYCVLKSCIIQNIDLFYLHFTFTFSILPFGISNTFVIYRLVHVSMVRLSLNCGHRRAYCSSPR